MPQHSDIILEAGTERAVASVGGDWSNLRVKRDIAISAALHLVLLALLLGLLPHWHDYAPPPQAVQLVIEEPPIEREAVSQPEPPRRRLTLPRLRRTASKAMLIGVEPTMTTLRVFTPRSYSR